MYFGLVSENLGAQEKVEWIVCYPFYSKDLFQHTTEIQKSNHNKEIRGKLSIACNILQVSGLVS